MRDRPLAVLSGGKSTIPLIDKLAEQYGLAFLYPQAAQYAASRDIPVVNLQALMDANRQLEAMNEALRLVGPMASDVDTVIDGLVDAMRREGIRRYQAYDTIKTIFLPRVFQIVGQSILQAKAWEEVASDFDVAICVTHEDVMANTKTMCQFWRAQGVPTLHVPHGVYMDTWRAGIGEDVHDEISCEWIATAGTYQREWYIARGADPEKVVITGLPQWDVWAEPVDQEHARRALRIDPDRPAVAFMSSWGQSTSALGIHGLVDQSYRAFLGASLGADWQAIVKLHPGNSQESADEHIKLAQNMGTSALVTPLYLDLVLAASDLIVSAGPSNVVIEAAMLNVRSVSTYGYPDDEQVITCEPDGLAETIEAGLAAEPDLAAFVEKYAHRNDGGATERVLELIGRIACR
jgi:hypothetical protein